MGPFLRHDDLRRLLLLSLVKGSTGGCHRLRLLRSLILEVHGLSPVLGVQLLPEDVRIL